MSVFRLGRAWQYRCGSCTLIVYVCVLFIFHISVCLSVCLSIWAEYDYSGSRGEVDDYLEASHGGETDSAECGGELN